MKAVRIYGTKDLRIDSLEKPKCGAGEVLAKTLYCGICGSDPPRIFGGDIEAELEVMGHEFSAVIEEVGEGVTNVKPGDIVTVVPVVPCQNCPDCATGHFGQCKNSRFIGAHYSDKGGMVEYNVFDAANVIPVPKGVSPVHAAFVEPITIALHAIFLNSMKPGQDVAIIGAGTIGQLVLQCAKALGAARTFVFDINPERLALAKRMGAYATYNTAEEGFLDAFMAETNGRGVKQVFEAVGLSETINLCIKIADVEAEIGVIGTMHHDVVFSPDVLYFMFSRKQMHMNGIWQSYSENFPGVEWRLALQLIADGKLNLDALIDREIDIDDVYENLLDYLVPNKVKGKIMVRMTPEK